MLKNTFILAAIIAAVGFIAGRALPVQQYIADMHVVSSDANARFLELGFNKAVAIDLPRDVKEVLVADPKTVTVVVRTMRRFTSPGQSWVIPTSSSTMMMAGRLPRWTSVCRNTTTRAMTNLAPAATERLSQGFYESADFGL